MPAATNGMLGNGGPSVAGRNGGSSFINGKGNASAFGNNIAQMNGNGAIVTEDQLSESHGNGLANGNGYSAANGNEVPLLNGNAHLSDGTQLGRAEETEDLLASVTELLIPYIKGADDAAAQKHTGQAYRAPSGEQQPVLVDYLKPADLVSRLKMTLPEEGKGKEGLLDSIAKILKYSVNTWDQGFMDKLFSANTPVGVISDLVLSVLNTNLHVYQVSPALTAIEKQTARALANLFGLNGPNAGGVTCQGGSSSNLTSMVIARNTLYPDAKAAGNAAHDFVVFTSCNGHYSVEKSAMICGMGSDAVWPVPADEQGCMKPSALRAMCIRAKEEGKTPFYVNATAGTTVRGAFEPLEEISAVCKEMGMWMHVDASFGGPVIFSKKHNWKLKGTHLADSLTINPHKMMNVPSTCSFLLGPDMRTFNKANSTVAGYLFHSHADGEVWDLADLTLQCGRRADSLKLALAWQYYGSSGFESQIDHAFNVAAHLFHTVGRSATLELLSPELPTCLQVCFYYAPNGEMLDDAKKNTEMTSTIVHRLIPRGFMVDYAPGDRGSFFRVVVNVQTQKGTVEGLAKAIEELGAELYGKQ